MIVYVVVSWIVVVKTVVDSPHPVVMTVVVGYTLVESAVEVAITSVLLVLVALHTPQEVSVAFAAGVELDSGDTFVLLVRRAEEVVSALTVVELLAEEVMDHTDQVLESELVLSPLTPVEDGLEEESGEVHRLVVDEVAEVSVVGDTSVLLDVVGPVGWVSAGDVHVVGVASVEELVVAGVEGVVASTEVLDASEVLPHALHESVRCLRPPRGLASVNAREAMTTARVLSCIFRVCGW